MTVFLWLYVLVGVAAAVVTVMALKKATNPDLSTEQTEEARELRDSTWYLERTVSTIPGGIWTCLILIVLFWPVVLVLFLRNQTR